MLEGRHESITRKTSMSVRIKVYQSKSRIGDFVTPWRGKVLERRQVFPFRYFCKFSNGTSTEFARILQSPNFAPFK